MAISNVSPLARAYYEHYMGTQRGGSFPVFRGSPYQYGEGLGEVLRGTGKYLLPLVTTAAKTFLESASSEMGKDKSMKLSAAAKKALKPTFEATAGKIAEQIVGGDSDQAGSGKRRKRGRKGKRRAPQKLYKPPIRARRTRRKTRNLLSPKFNF